MLRFLRRIFRDVHPLDTENLGEKARDVAFRVMEESDAGTCMSFYRGNEAHFPPRRCEHYEAELKKRTWLTLIATRQGRPMGCCGIVYNHARNVATFCFGMVDPVYQRQGIGTAQVLVRLASLTTANDLMTVAMFVVPDAVSFYRRFGFDFSREAPADDGCVYPVGLLRISQSSIEDCRGVLAERNITYPDIRDRIPQHAESKSVIYL